MYMNERFELPWEQLLHLINGRDVNGFPLSASAISIDEVLQSENKAITVNNAAMDQGAVTISMSGGCVVADVSFGKESKPQYEAARLLAERWMDEIRSEGKDNLILSMTVTPVLLQGTFFLVLTDLAYASGFEAGDGFRLVLAFDNDRTIPVVSDEVDIDAMIREIDSEMTRQIEEMRRIVEEPDAEDENPYEEKLKKQMSAITFDNSQDTPAQQERRGMRIVKEKEDRHE